MSEQRPQWQKRLAAIEPSVLLVEAPLLRRIARVSQQISALAWRVPHQDVYVLDRERLLDLATESELGINKPGDLRPQVVLVAWPPGEHAEDALAGLLLRRLVHGWVELHWRSVPEEQQNRLAWQRVQQLGGAEWEEIVAVADQDGWLPRHGLPDYAIYREFAAHWWELRLACPQRLPLWFPTLAPQAQRIDEVLLQDVDIPQLQRKLRQAHWPMPQELNPKEHSREATVSASAQAQSREAPSNKSPTGPGEVFVKSLAANPAQSAEPVVIRDSSAWPRVEAAAKKGNVVRAALLCWQVSLTLPASFRPLWQREARHFLGELAQRLASIFPPLSQTLEEQLAEKDTWHNTLCALLPAAAEQGYFSQEARVLYDLQRLAEDAQRGVYVVDLAGWLRTWGSLAWRRQQPLLQQFLVLRRLRSARHRLALCSLDDAMRLRLATLLESAIHEWEMRLRQLVGPILRRVLHDVGLVPHNLAEQIELERLVQELADRVVETGHIRLGQLRDAISRSQLKLPDLRGPSEWWRGDPLLAADKRLAHELDGIYRRGEVYLRWFQRFSSLFFGTWLGRLLSLFLILPFLGAYIILEGIDHVLVHPLAGLWGLDFHISGRFQVFALGAFLVGVINLVQFRRVVVRWCRLGFRGLRWLLWDLPRRVLRWPPLLRLWQSTPLVIFRRHLILPLALATGTLAACAWWEVEGNWLQLSVGLAALFGLMVTLTREGHIALATCGDYLAWTFRYLSLEWITLSLQWILALFQRLLNYVERLQYRIDEWLRYRGGESRWRLVWKALASLVWSWLAYILRFSVYLLIEPQINPIKHFPVVTVSHKLLLAGLPIFTVWTLNLLGWEPNDVNKAKAAALVTSIIWAIPGVFGFLAWELKENWKLYQANRSATLRPLHIGHHGETVAQFLRPGVHSGTLRKFFRQGRRIFADQATTTSPHSSARWHRQRHHHQETLHAFVERNFVRLLRHCPDWTGPALEVKDVELGVSTITVHIASHPRERTERASDLTMGVLRISCQGGWIVAEWLQPGWLATLPAPARAVLHRALDGLYHWAGAEVLSERLRETIPPDYQWRLEWEGLRLCRRERPEQSVLYPWQESGPIEPTNGAPDPWPTLPAEQVWYQTRPIAWHDWENSWPSPRELIAESPHASQLARSAS
ncbi:MAG: hypothetical protein NZM42_00720 [Gemmatales bacterium]|nr:hypothetical protein [Gemmatales bacterium]